MTEKFDITKLNKHKEYIVDVMECTVTHPRIKEIQREYYSEKKHTIKIQIIIEEDTKKIVYVAFDKDSTHDFALFKNSTQDMTKDIPILGHSDYQRLDKILINSLTQKKKSKLHPLTNQDKDLNHLISSIRIAIEHVNSQLKIFRILSEHHRNHKHNFIPRALFLYFLYNFCLDI